MKTKWIISLAIFFFFGIATSFAANNKIKGNGKAVKKVFSIEDYEKISSAGPVVFVYEQSSASPYLEVTLDENLFEYLKVEVKEKELQIGPKSVMTILGNTSYNLQPTVFKVKSNSKTLKELNTAGSGDFIINSTLSTDRLVLNLAGSGNIQLPKPLAVSRLELNTAGSGSIRSDNLKADELSCNVAGSGSASLAGTTDKASFNLSGSGSVKAYGCKANTVSCSIAGSGSVETYADNKLSANIIGSGDIYYKGDPEVKKSTMGSGKVQASN